MLPYWDYIKRKTSSFIPFPYKISHIPFSLGKLSCNSLQSMFAEYISARVDFLSLATSDRGVYFFANIMLLFKKIKKLAIGTKFACDNFEACTGRQTNSPECPLGTSCVRPRNGLLCQTYIIFGIE